MCPWFYVYLGCGEEKRAGNDSTVCYSVSLRKGQHAVQGRVAPELIRRQNEWNYVWAKACFIFFERRNGRSRVQAWAGLGLDSLNNVGVVWTIGMVTDCSVHGPG